jgi:tetratricopeptide (TPR) repeat protein
MTLTGQFVGSLPWASPEQAEGSPGKIDLRTDVYSLGVILYQMLTAKFPYDVIGPMRDVLDHIMHSQPIRPRMTGGARLARLIDDEVETIILKCLQKERDRRYQTAGELARDVRRYLAGEPIEAKRDSLTYLLRKQVRRHWRPAIAVAVVLLAITVGLVASLTAWRRAATDRARAVTAEADQRRAAAKAQAINVFLQEMLGSADPGKGPGKDVTVLSVLDDAAAKLDAGDMRDQPNVEAGVRSAIGNSYRSLGDFPAAEDNLRLAVQLNERVYGRRNLQVADSRVDLGQVLRTLVDFKGAESQYQEALAIYRAVHNSDSRGEAACLHHLALLRRTQGQYDAAEELYRQAIEMRQRVLGRDHSDVAESLSALGELCYERQDLDQAEALFREADQVNRGFFGDDHPTVAAGLNDLGAILHARGEYDQAEELYRQAVAMGRRLLGDEHPLVGQALNNLAMTLSAQRRPASAEPLFLQALALRRKQMGAEHPDVAVVANNLAAFYTSLGQPDRAEELYRDAIAIRRAALPMSPELAKSLVSYSLLLLECARAGEAEPLLREALDIRASTLAADDVKIPHTQSILGECLTALGSFDEAEPLLWQSWQALRVHRDATPERIERARTRLLRFYRASGRAAALPDESAAADDQGDSSPQADPP